MMNFVLDSANAGVPMTYLGSAIAARLSIGGVPLGLVNGELVVKVSGPGSGIPTTDGGAGWMQLRGSGDDSPFTSSDLTGGSALTAEPSTGKCFVLDDIIISCDTAMVLTFTCQPSGIGIPYGPLYLPANYVGQITTRGKIKLPADNNLFVTASVMGNISIQVLYHEEAP